MELMRFDIMRNAADLAYTNRQLSKAADFYGQALQYADRLQVLELIDECQQWRGTCFYQLGRLKDALATLGPILQRTIGRTRNEDRFMALIQYIQTAQRLPVPLETVQAAYTQIQSFLADIGHT